MSVRDPESHVFARPSPGEILRRQDRNIYPHGTPAHQAPSIEINQNRHERIDTGVDIPAETFRSDFFVAALQERGVLLAPLIVQWHYKIGSARNFFKWLKTREFLISPARLGIHPITSNIRYFGTYLEQGVAADGLHDETETLVSGQTLWGFGSEESMTHLFQLCRGNVERLNIVETDLRDFVLGLKSQIGDVGLEHFSQRVLVTPATL